MGAGEGDALIPTDLSAWTIAKVQEVVASGTTENDLYDFKADLQHADGQRKVVAAFANTRGGYLIFGCRFCSTHPGEKVGPRFRARMYFGCNALRPNPEGDPRWKIRTI